MGSLLTDSWLASHIKQRRGEEEDEEEEEEEEEGEKKGERGSRWQGKGK